MVGLWMNQNFAIVTQMQQSAIVTNVVECNSQFQMAKCKYDSCTAGLRLFRLEGNQNQHWTFCNHFKYILNHLEHFVPVRTSPVECLALGYILNYYIKVIKICTKKINKGTGDEFSASQLPDAFVQLSDPGDGGDVIPSQLLTYLSRLTFMSGNAWPHSTTESGGLRLAPYYFTYSSHHSSYITARWLCIEPGDMNLQKLDGWETRGRTKRAR